MVCRCLQVFTIYYCTRAHSTIAYLLVDHMNAYDVLYWLCVHLNNKHRNNISKSVGHNAPSRPALCMVERSSFRVTCLSSSYYLVFFYFENFIENALPLLEELANIDLNDP